MPDFRLQLPPFLLERYGRWVKHDHPVPGVVRHLAADGSQCWTVRLHLPPGGMLSSSSLRLLARWVREYAQVGRRTSRQGFELVGVDPGRLPQLLEEVRRAGFLPGSAGPTLRQVKACVGFLHCPNAVVDSPGLAQALAEVLLALEGEGLPAALRVSVAGCPNDCGGGRGADLGLVGVFAEAPEAEEGEIPEAEARLLRAFCPGRAILSRRLRSGGYSLTIRPDRCVRCLYCLALAPGLLRPRGEPGVALYAGGCAGLHPRLGSRLVAFLPAHPPGYREVVSRVTDLVRWWREEARPGERLGAWLERKGGAW